MIEIAILHAYSASNAGDGLLVDAALDLLEETFPGSRYTVLARYPDSFRPRERVRFESTRWSAADSRRARAVLRGLDDFDLVVAVGGGYLRFGGLVETAKTLVAHLPQLAAAARTSTPTVYLPQSIGPGSRLVRAFLRGLLRRVDLVCLRDDRSMAELRLAGAMRLPDMALLDPRWTARSAPLTDDRPILSVRPVRAEGASRLAVLAALLRPFDGWVQSTGAGNDDRRAVAATQPERVLTREEYAGGSRRVVIAVRLHAALMALRAGHWVVHLAYERKGFGAFADLGLQDHVHSVYGFDPDAVSVQARTLIDDGQSRERYDDAVRNALEAFRRQRLGLQERLVGLVARGRGG